jgi:hypothetical protein
MPSQKKEGFKKYTHTLLSDSRELPKFRNRLESKNHAFAFGFGPRCLGPETISRALSGYSATGPQTGNGLDTGTKKPLSDG